VVGAGAAVVGAGAAVVGAGAAVVGAGAAVVGGVGTFIHFSNNQEPYLLHTRPGSQPHPKREVIVQISPSFAKG